jgi:hypothetical protein
LRGGFGRASGRASLVDAGVAAGVLGVPNII